MSEGLTLVILYGETLEYDLRQWPSEPMECCLRSCEKNKKIISE